MPSVTDVQQQSSNNNGKSTPPPSTQQISTDTTNVDPITQAILVLEKKQRNLGKRKEKLESYEQEAKSGKELHKDQKEALAKYPEVLGQIECTKDLSEQFKKIQTESSKNQKRLSKQAAEEKRLQTSQRLREYVQLRYLLDHRPTSLTSEESSLLDELSRVIIPLDNSSDAISRSVDTVLAIYQGGSSSSVKNLTGKNLKEVRDTLEELIKNFDKQISSSSELPPQQEQTKELDQTNDIQSSNRNLNEYPLQFDTRTQNIPLEQIIEDSPFFPIDLTKTQLEQENALQQSPDPNQYLQTFTVINSNITDQPLSSIQNPREETLMNVVAENNVPTDEQQQSDEQWQQRRGAGNANRAGRYYNDGTNRNYNRGWNANYNQQQWRGPRGGRYDNSYSGGQQQQQQYYDNTRGRPGGFNSGYRGNRGGGYRGGNRGNGGYNGDGYQKSDQYQQQQQQQVRSVPPSEQQ